MLLTTLLVAGQIALEPRNTKTDVNWIGVSAPSANVVWVSGSLSTIARSLDGGQTWTYSQPASADLQFRDIEALDSEHAYALSIGKNGDSRLYYTNSGGSNWQLSYRAGAEQFLDCLAIAPRSNEAWIYGDSIDGQWDLVRSADGRNWLRSRNAISNSPLAGEGGLAASGGCARFNNSTWAIGTANANTARLLVKRNFGIRFQTIDTPIPAGPGAGIASVWPFAEDDVLLAGGDLNDPDREPRLVRYQNDGFTTLASPPIKGAIYSMTLTAQEGLLVSNPNGAAWLPSLSSSDWVKLADENIWNSACAGEYCYLVGKEGYVARVKLPPAKTTPRSDD